VIKEIHTVEVDGSPDALLAIHDSGDSVENAAELVCGISLHFRHGDKRGKIVYQFPFVLKMLLENGSRAAVVFSGEW